MTSSLRLLCAGLALAVLPPAPLLAAGGSAPSDAELVRQGEYLAQLGDCAACHTGSASAPLAGGLPIDTPFGVIYSTNITPDADTGIGRYSFEQFDRAMRQGVAADGHNLYPAMPYTSFAKVSPQDMRALYAYLMRGVKPAKRPNLQSDLPWPFSARPGLSLWRTAFLDAETYKPDPAKSARWNRGAYIVEGLGHCGACHTPRGMAFEEKATSDSGSDGAAYLSGATLDAWHAPSLRGGWTAREFARFLKTGRNEHAAAYGSMTEVIHFSTQQLSDDDLAAVGEYLASLPRAGSSPRASAAVAAAQTGQELYTTRGGLGYVQFCSTCHRPDGRGVSDIFPPLAGNESLQSPDPSSVIHVVLSGWRSARTRAYPKAFGMPAFSILSDQELAEITTFVRTRWGNQGDAVSADQIGKLRAEIGLELRGPSPFATPRLAAILQSPNREQLTYGLRLMMQTKALLPDTVGAFLSCDSCHPNGGTVANGSPYVGVAALFPSYQPRAGKIIDFKDRINGCFRRSMNGKALARDSREMLAMEAYADWMKGDTKPKQAIPGRGNGPINEALVPDAGHGKLIYEEQCAICHGKDGEGARQADGSYVFPPLWGEASFNIGAGIARTFKAAAFVKSNMPLANNLKFPLGQGGLTDQQAVDVAEYFTHMPRADFPDKVKDFPNGGKPRDSRY